MTKSRAAEFLASDRDEEHPGSGLVMGSGRSLRTCLLWNLQLHTVIVRIQGDHHSVHDPCQIHKGYSIRNQQSRIVHDDISNSEVAVKCAR